MEVGKESVEHRVVVGGVDTHKDLHVASVVNEQDQVLGTQCFATTRQGYRLMLAWMRSFGQVQRIGIESTGTYGAGLLRFMHKAGIEILTLTHISLEQLRSSYSSQIWQLAGVEQENGDAGRCALLGRDTVRVG
jgi:hypothetical protein